MARALIVGCGRRGRKLGAVLVDSGWVVRGTTRDETKLAEIEAEGIEAVLADPDRVGTVVEQLEGVAVVVWLMGSAEAEEQASAVNGPRLERMLEKLVDSPVRGFVYEAAGTVDQEVLGGGVALVAEAAARWHIPIRTIEVEPDPIEPWLDSSSSAIEGLIAG
ncbi:hypothetical protein BH10ACT11_BH10ACT11_13110 [soil metagenome]